VDWFEHRAAHELVGLGEVYPAHFGQLLLVADKRLGSVNRAGGQVDHLAPSVGVDAAAYDTRSLYPQTCSSLTSRTAASAGFSPGSISPAMNVHRGWPSLRLATSTPRRLVTMAAAIGSLVIYRITVLGTDAVMTAIRRRLGTPLGGPRAGLSW